jgi:hypothetical protein
MVTKIFVWEISPKSNDKEVKNMRMSWSRSFGSQLEVGEGR